MPHAMLVKGLILKTNEYLCFSFYLLYHQQHNKSVCYGTIEGTNGKVLFQFAQKYFRSSERFSSI